MSLWLTPLCIVPMVVLNRANRLLTNLTNLSTKVNDKRPIKVFNIYPNVSTGLIINVTHFISD